MSTTTTERPTGRRRLEVVLAGMFGGMAPNLMGMAGNAVRQGQEGYLVANLGFWLGTIVLGLMSAALVYFFKETSSKKAVALGVAAPGLILGFTNASPAVQGGGEHAGDHAAVAALTGFVDTGTHTATNAVYSPTEASAWTESDSIFVLLSGLGEVEGSDVDLIAIVHSDDGSIHEELIRHVAPYDVPVAIPDSTLEIYLHVDGAESNRLKLSDAAGETVTVEVLVEKRGILSGIARAFGRKVADRRVEIRFVPSQGPETLRS